MKGGILIKLGKPGRVDQNTYLAETMTVAIEIFFELGGVLDRGEFEQEIELLIVKYTFRFQKRQK